MKNKKLFAIAISAFMLASSPLTFAMSRTTSEKIAVSQDEFTYDTNSELIDPSKLPKSFKELQNFTIHGKPVKKIIYRTFTWSTSLILKLSQNGGCMLRDADSDYTRCTFTNKNFPGLMFVLEFSINDAERLDEEDKISDASISKAIKDSYELLHSICPRLARFVQKASGDEAYDMCQKISSSLPTPTEPVPVSQPPLVTELNALTGQSDVYDTAELSCPANPPMTYEDLCLTLPAVNHIIYRVSEIENLTEKMVMDMVKSTASNKNQTLITIVSPYGKRPVLCYIICEDDKSFIFDMRQNCPKAPANSHDIFLTKHLITYLSDPYSYRTHVIEQRKLPSVKSLKQTGSKNVHAYRSDTPI